MSNSAHCLDQKQLRGKKYKNCNFLFYILQNNNSVINLYQLAVKCETYHNLT